jgi:hypothetical protein
MKNVLKNNPVYSFLVNPGAMVSLMHFLPTRCEGTKFHQEYIMTYPVLISYNKAT